VLHVAFIEGILITFFDEVIHMQYNAAKERASKNAEASLLMEGFHITPEIQRNADRIERGKSALRSASKRCWPSPAIKRTDTFDLQSRCFF